MLVHMCCVTTKLVSVRNVILLHGHCFSGFRHGFFQQNFFKVPQFEFRDLFEFLDFLSVELPILSFGKEYCNCYCDSSLLSQTAFTALLLDSFLLPLQGSCSQKVVSLYENGSVFVKKETGNIFTILNAVDA
jgi:hypothetical protein